MAANASLSPAKPVPVNRPCLFVFESNLQGAQLPEADLLDAYDLRLFSEEQAFLRDLEAMHRPSLVLLAWDGISQSMPLFSRVRTSRPEIPVLILATIAEMADYEVFRPPGRRRRRAEALCRRFAGSRHRQAPACPQGRGRRAQGDPARRRPLLCALQQAHVRDRGAGPARRPLRYSRPDPGRKRYRQRDRRDVHPPDVAAQRPHVPEGQLRGHARRPAGERALRV